MSVLPMLPSRYSILGGKVNWIHPFSSMKNRNLLLGLFWRLDLRPVLRASLESLLGRSIRHFRYLDPVRAVLSVCLRLPAPPRPLGRSAPRTFLPSWMRSPSCRKWRTSTSSTMNEITHHYRRAGPAMAQGMRGEARHWILVQVLEVI